MFAYILNGYLQDTIGNKDEALLRYRFLHFSLYTPVRHLRFGTLV